MLLVQAAVERQEMVVRHGTAMARHGKAQKVGSWAMCALLCLCVRLHWLLSLLLGVLLLVLLALSELLSLPSDAVLPLSFTSTGPQVDSIVSTVH